MVKTSRISDNTPTGFTHYFTPNDFHISNNEVMEYYHDGYLRIFERLRSNPRCDVDSNNLCEIMAKIAKPGIDFSVIFYRIF